MSYRGRKQGSYGDSRKRSGKSYRLAKRPVFFVKDQQLQKGTLTSTGEIIDPQIIDKTTVKTGDYEKVNAPNLYPAKEAQRKDLVKSVSGGTVLETHAGRGNLTKEVYAKKLDNAILVDSDKKALSSADRKLHGKIKREIEVANNVKWLEQRRKVKEHVEKIFEDKA